MSRMEQVNSLLLKELAGIINREIDIEGALVSVSYVECAPDLREAKVGISVLPENKSAETMKRLRSGTGFLIHKLKAKVKIKYIPDLKWELDVSEREAAEIGDILKNLEEKE